MIILLVLILSTSFLVLGISCKEEAAGAEATEEAVETAEEVEETVEEEAIEVEEELEEAVLNLGLIGESKDDFDLYDRIVGDFMVENPNIEVKVDWLPWGEALAKFKTQFAAGTPPDVFWLWVNEFQFYYSTNNLLNISPYVEADGFALDEYFPVSVDAYTGGDGNLYAMPREISGMVIYYNKDMFDDAGIDYPAEDWTWDDFLAVAKQLTVKDDNGNVVQYGSAPLTDYRGYTSILWSFGGEVLNENRTECTLDSQEAIDAVQWIADTINVEGITPTPAEGANFEQLFLSNKVAMFISGRWSTQQLWNAEDAPNWDIAHMPYGPAGRFTRSSAGSHAIAAATKYPDQAWKLVKYLSSADLMDAFAASGLVVPAYEPSAYSDTFLQPEMENPANPEIFLDCLEYGKLEPVNTPAFPEIDATMYAELDAVWSGAKTAEKFAQNVKVLIDDILATQ